MTEMYKDEQSSKKKFLVPLIVLLLCGVALTGAAYAWDATIDNEGNKIDVQALNMTLGDENGTLTTEMIDLSVKVGSHSVNGHAYDKDSNKGFLSADGDPSAEATKTNSLVGYYMKVEVVDNNTKTEQNPGGTTVSGNDVVVAKFTLKATNKGDATVAVKVSLTMDEGSAAQGTTDVKGVTSLYLQITNQATDSTEKVYVDIIGEAHKSSEKASTATLAAIAANGDATYEIAVMCTTADYFDANATLPATTNFAFSVNFETVAPTA